MAKDEPKVHEGLNFGLTGEDLAEIGKLTREIVVLEGKRSEINADMNAKRKAIKALGVDLTAWAASKARFHMDPEQRMEFDRSRELCDKSLGVPVQADLFAGEQKDTEDGKVTRIKPATTLPTGLGPTVN